MPFLNIENIVMNFGGLRALDRVSIEVKEGAIQGLIGPNGSGKTTLFNVISGVYKPFTGNIILQDQNITGLPPHRIAELGIARTFQITQLFDQMTVLDTIKVGSHCRGTVELISALLNFRSTKEEEQKIEEDSLEILEFLNLTDLRDELTKNLAYGQQRLVDIGRALASRPRLIMLDEPAAGMNHREIDILIEYIRKIHERGYTIFIVEHDMRLIMQLCQFISVLNFGVNIAEGGPLEIQNNLKVVEAYLGKGAEF
jgi:branched-chain amino acid transport system ATP-binding protein